MCGDLNHLAAQAAATVQKTEAGQQSIALITFIKRASQGFRAVTCSTCSVRSLNISATPRWWVLHEDSDQLAAEFLQRRTRHTRDHPRLFHLCVFGDTRPPWGGETERSSAEGSSLDCPPRSRVASALSMSQSEMQMHRNSLPMISTAKHPGHKPSRSTCPARASLTKSGMYPRESTQIQNSAWRQKHRSVK